mgnify:FL=1
MTLLILIKNILVYACFLDIGEIFRLKSTKKDDNFGILFRTTDKTEFLNLKFTPKIVITLV